MGRVIEAPNEWMETFIKDVVKRVDEKVFKVQWHPILIPFKYGGNKTILKNLKQQFMSVIMSYIELCKNFGIRHMETDGNAAAIEP